MKPDFALTFTAEGIALVHRASAGWVRVGTVTLGDADMADALAAMRQRAYSLSKTPLCKLVIPNDQIKYLSIRTGEAPEDAVREALADATPYAVEELEYDWTAEGGVIQVAAVARETLAEAEAFATEHDFDAVSFAAIPQDGDFRGEPFFGLTARAGDLLPPDATVEREATVIEITGDAQIPPAMPDDNAGDDTPVASAAAQAVADAPPAPKPAKPKETKETSKGSGGQAAPPPYGPESRDAAGGATAPDTAKPEAPPDEQGKSGSASAGTGVGAFTTIRAPRADAGDSDTPPVSSASRLGGADTAPALGAAPPVAGPADEEVGDPARLADLAASLQPDPEARLDRDAAPEAPPLDPAPHNKPGFLARGKKAEAGGKAGQGASSAFEAERQRMTVFGARGAPVGGKPRFLGLILTALLLVFLVIAAAWASLFLDDGLASLFGPADDSEIAAAPATEDPARQAAGTATTGQGDSDEGVVAPLPDSEGEDRVAALPDTEESSEVAALPDLPAPLDPAEAKARYAATGIWQKAPVPPEIPGSGTSVADIYEASVDTTPDLGDPAALPRRKPDTRDMRPESPTLPPPPGTRFDFNDRGFVRATPEGTLTPQGVRVVAGAPPLTPPEDMVQTITVTATEDTAEGDIAPGTKLTGDPTLADIRPRPRPDGLASEEVDTAPQPQPDDDAADDASDSDTQGQDEATVDTARNTALAVLRPSPRPNGLATAGADTAEATPTDADDGADDESGNVTQDRDEARNADDGTTADTVQNASLAGLRPRVRPEAVSAGGTTPQDVARAPMIDGASPDGDAPDDDAPDSSDTATDSFDNATPQAVTASLTPSRRPGGFAATVKRARARAAARPVSTRQSVQPAVPTTASVAREATDEDVIDLSRVNLIGVYGSTSNRRALVRLGNGRYKKVQVGDRLDGGQVAAIGDSELRYIKRGNNVVLRIPQG